MSNPHNANCMGYKNYATGQLIVATSSDARFCFQAQSLWAEWVLEEGELRSLHVYGQTLRRAWYEASGAEDLDRNNPRQLLQALALDAWDFSVDWDEVAETFDVKFREGAQP